MWPCTDTQFLEKGQLLVFRELQIFLDYTKTQEVEISSRLTERWNRNHYKLYVLCYIKIHQFIFDLCIVLNHSLTI